MFPMRRTEIFILLSFAQCNSYFPKGIRIVLRTFFPREKSRPFLLAKLGFCQEVSRKTVGLSRNQKRALLRWMRKRADKRSLLLRNLTALSVTTQLSVTNSASCFATLL